MICAYRRPYELCTVPSPTGTVIRSGSLTTMNGHRKLFHAVTKVNTPTAASTGRDIGSTTLQNIRSRLAPSSAAACSYSRGMPSKNFFRMKTITGAASCGRIMPQ